MANLVYLKDLWDDDAAAALAGDELGLLRYRSNLLGSDLRITNFGGGNTSSKIDMEDPFTKKPVSVLAVKGSGGDIGSITRQGFALLYMDRLNDLAGIYRGEAHEDEMVGYYPLAAFGHNKVAASIDTPLHAFLPFPHVDHLHPDWAIALAASANGKAKMEEFNQRFGHHLVWLPWQRPGFELGLMLRRAVEQNPQCDGIVLGSHGLFTWGMTQRECYLSSVTIIDQLGQFVLEHQGKAGAKLFGGARTETYQNAAELAADILPYLRGQVSSVRRQIGHYSGAPDVLRFVNSAHAADLARLGTSCPDHFIRTRICPLLVEWDAESIDQSKANIADALVAYRSAYDAYYKANAEPDSPKLRDPNPSVVLMPGIGMFTFGKNKTEARITSEFYTNAIHVMEGATALASGDDPAELPQAKRAEDAAHFSALHNYVALPPREAFRIEYWALEEAKLQRMPPEARFSRQIVLVAGGGSGIGRATALKLAKDGAHLMIVDKIGDSAKETAEMALKLTSKEAIAHCEADLTIRESLAAAVRETVKRYGGLDAVVNTAAVFIAPDSHGVLQDSLWKLTFDINVTGNYLLVDEAKKVMSAQKLPGVVVLTSSANAVVSKRGSEAYDISKAAVNHMIRELAIGLAPMIRVNGIAPATVVEGSTMFSRERLIPSLNKYNIDYAEEESTESLRTKLASFYAQRTLTKQAIRPDDCANAICWLLSVEAAKTTGHVIPVDAGLADAFLR